MPDDKQGEALVQISLAAGGKDFGVCPRRIPTAALNPEDGRAVTFLRIDPVEGQRHSVLPAINFVSVDPDTGACRLRCSRNHEQDDGETEWKTCHGILQPRNNVGVEFYQI